MFVCGVFAVCVRVVSWAGFYGLNFNVSLCLTHLCISWYMYSLVYLICMFYFVCTCSSLLISQVRFVVILKSGFKLNKCSV